MQRALPLAVGIATLQAAFALLFHLRPGEGIVDLHVLRFARRQVFLVGVIAPDIDKLKIVVRVSAHARPPLRASVRFTQAAQQ